MTEPEPQPVVPKPKLRWYQYSLRTLLTVVLICTIPCSWLGWEANRARRQARNMDAFRELVSEEWIWSDYEWFFVREPRRPTWLWSRIGYSLDQKVVEMRVPVRNAERAIGILKEMPYLQTVSIEGWYTRPSQKHRVETEVELATAKVQQAMPGVAVTGLVMRARE